MFSVQSKRKVLLFGIIQSGVYGTIDLIISEGMLLGPRALLFIYFEHVFSMLSGIKSPNLSLILQLKLMSVWIGNRCLNTGFRTAVVRLTAGGYPCFLYITIL